MPETIRVYELVYIIAPDRTEDQVTAINAKYHGLIEANGGKVDKVDIWERRKLAYEIKGYNEGLYVVVVFHGFPKTEAELRRVFHISEDTLRFILVRPDEDQIVLDTPAPQPSVAVAPEAEPIIPIAEPEAAVPSEEVVDAAPVAEEESVAVAEPIVPEAASESEAVEGS